jgi:hypothetical protein
MKLNFNLKYLEILKFDKKCGHLERLTVVDSIDSWCQIGQENLFEGCTHTQTDRQSDGIYTRRAVARRKNSCTWVKTVACWLCWFVYKSLLDAAHFKFSDNTQVATWDFGVVFQIHGRYRRFSALLQTTVMWLNKQSVDYIQNFSANCSNVLECSTKRRTTLLNSFNQACYTFQPKCAQKHFLVRKIWI